MHVIATGQVQFLAGMGNLARLPVPIWRKKGLATISDRKAA
jgi:hypothetical protein